MRSAMKNIGILGFLSILLIFGGGAWAEEKMRPLEIMEENIQPDGHEGIHSPRGIHPPKGSKGPSNKFKPRDDAYEKKEQPHQPADASPTNRSKSKIKKEAKADPYGLDLWSKTDLFDTDSGLKPGLKSDLFKRKNDFSVENKGSSTLKSKPYTTNQLLVTEPKFESYLEREETGEDNEEDNPKNNVKKSKQKYVVDPDYLE